MAKTIGIESRRKAKAGRMYEIPVSEREKAWVWSITSILSVLNKPALVGWSGKVERESCLEAFWRFLVCGTSGEAPADGDQDNGEWQAHPDIVDKMWNRARLFAVLQAILGKTKAAQKLLAEAGEIGTQAHARCEWLVRKWLGLLVGPEPQCCERALWASLSFEDWAAAHHFKPIASEMVVYSALYDCAGTLDIVGYVDGEKQIVDIKTAKAVWPEARLQVAAYAKLYESMGLCEPGEIKTCTILRIPKNLQDPDFEAVAVTNLDELWEAFLHAGALWCWQQSMNEQN